MIPSIDFGGSGTTLHFAHANGYPPRAYTPLLQALSANFHTIAMPLRPLWPEAAPQSMRSWFTLADDLIQFLDSRHSAPVIGVGHSVGATVTLMAALQRPDLFRALVLIDPVIMPPWFARLWQLFTWLKLGPRLHPLAASAQRRRRNFESYEAMFASYRRKNVFQHMDDTALKIYTEALTQLQPDGSLTLRYTPEWEVQIYLTGILHDPILWKQLPGLQLRLLVLAAQNSNTFWPQTARLLQRRLPDANIRFVADSTHLLPLEKPAEVAEEIRQFLTVS